MKSQHTYNNADFRPSNSPKNTPVFRLDSSGKEKDSETGYHYFGARYYNSDLSLWLSVDPMSDKYPSLSPYNYCAWNPLILTDPTGDSIFLNSKDASLMNEALVMINERIGSHLRFSLGGNGGLIANGTAITEEEEYILRMVNSEDVRVNLMIQDNDRLSHTEIINPGGGSYGGNKLDEIHDKMSPGNIKLLATAKQTINVKNLKKYDRLSWSTGELIWHEISEAYEGGRIAIKERRASPAATKTGSTYNRAHSTANQHFLGDILVDNIYNPTMAILYNKCTNPKFLTR